MHKTPLEIENKLKSFKLWLLRLGYAESTTESYTKLLNNFFTYLKGEAPTQEHIIDFNAYLHQTKISRTYIQAHITAIKRYSTYLEKTQGEKLMIGEIIIDRALQTERTIFTSAEIQQLFEVTDHTPKGVFDKALLSIYYGCGLRSKEGIYLKPKDIDYSKGLVYVQPSKNYKSRYVPISQRLAVDLHEYELYAREIINPDSPYLLPGILGDKTNGAYLNKRLKLLLEKAAIPKKATLHSLRHSIATHLLQQGMELEAISQFLGHRSLEATEVYVRMNHELFILNEDGKL
ncbi:tyrosine-type recombinase/integrase [Aquimarina sp. 2201CG1-2-11]|uniref:tyrosine-type recombinase/integrase n=1 Tax=Aquimarina discodermiae TaxID=3231043 RepID=UPI003462E0E4